MYLTFRVDDAEATFQQFMNALSPAYTKSFKACKRMALNEQTVDTFPFRYSDSAVQNIVMDHHPDDTPTIIRENDPPHPADTMMPMYEPHMRVQMAQNLQLPGTTTEGS
jgi:hypothetical protein